MNIQEILGFEAYWYWLVLGMALLVMEIITPGIFLMWVGSASILTGMVCVVFNDLSLGYQVLVFAGFSMGAVISWFKVKPFEGGGSLISLNRRGAQMVGREVTITEEVSDGIGQARLDDSVWRVIGPPMKPGDKAIVKEVEGNTLKLRKLQ